MSYYQEVEGLMIPMFMEVKFDGATVQKITMSEVIINPEIDKTMFSIPKKN